MQLVAVRRKSSSPLAVDQWNLEGKLVGIEFRIVAFQADRALIEAIESAMLFTACVAIHVHLNAQRGRPGMQRAQPDAIDGRRFRRLCLRGEGDQH